LNVKPGKELTVMKITPVFLIRSLMLGSLGELTGVSARER